MDLDKLAREDKELARLLATSSKAAAKYSAAVVAEEKAHQAYSAAHKAVQDHLSKIAQKAAQDQKDAVHAEQVRQVFEK